MDVVDGVTYGLFTPGDLLNEMQSIDTAMRALANDMLQVSEHVRKSNSSLDNHIKAFSAFWNDWKRFYADKQGWITRAFNSTRDKTLEYRDRLYQFRKRFADMGGKVSYVGLPKRDLFAGTDFKKVGYVALGLAALILLWKLR